MSVLPAAVLDALKCIECDMYLSIPPIKIREDGSNVCGRCPQKEEKVVEEADYRMTHAKGFENFLKQLLLPCSFLKSGCRRIFYWNTVKDHEEECPFRTYNCPALDDIHGCNWKDTSYILQEHFATEHPDLLLLTPTFEMQLDCDAQVNRLLPALDQLFLFQTQLSVKEKTLWACVRYIGPFENASNYEYDLEFGDNVLIKGKTTENDKTTLLQKNLAVPIDIQGLLLLLKNQTIVPCTVKISPIEGNNVKFEQSDALVLCKWMDCLHVAPLHSIQTHHLECEKKIEKCKWNGCTTEASRSEILKHEEICDLRANSCRWQNCNYQGSQKDVDEHREKCNKRLAKCIWENCNFVGSWEAVEEHERRCSEKQKSCKWANCNYVTNQHEVTFHEDVCEHRDKNVYKCWFCSWPGTQPALIQHLRQQHPKRLHEGNKVTVSVGTVFNWYMLLDEELFRCTSRRGFNFGKTLVFSVTYIGDEVGAEKYFMEIDLVHPQHKEETLTLRGDCRYYDGVYKCVTLEHEKAKDFEQSNSIKFDFRLSTNSVIN